MHMCCTHSAHSCTSHSCRLCIASVWSVLTSTKENAPGHTRLPGLSTGTRASAHRCAHSLQQGLDSPTPFLTPMLLSITSWGQGVHSVLFSTSSPTYCRNSAVSAPLIQFQIHMQLGVQLPPECGVWDLPDSWVISPCDRFFPCDSSVLLGPLKTGAVCPLSD